MYKTLSNYNINFFTLCFWIMSLKFHDSERVRKLLKTNINLLNQNCKIIKVNEIVILNCLISNNIKYFLNLVGKRDFLSVILTLGFFFLSYVHAIHFFKHFQSNKGLVINRLIQIFRCIVTHLTPQSALAR